MSDSTLRALQEKGLQRGLHVPIRDGVLLYARLDGTGGYFICREREFSAEDVRTLLDILTRFALVLRN